MTAVINSGSSSVKFALFEGEKVLRREVLEVTKGHHEVLAKLLDSLEGICLEFVAHRVVHGGNVFVAPTLMNKKKVQKLKELTPLAPLHNPANIEAIEYFLQHHPDIPQIAVFDTAFHATMPQEAYVYAIERKFEHERHIRRYGFHGSSHAYLTKEAAKLLQKEPASCNLITLHLGSGASTCAVMNGKSIDTSMGFTPLEGLVMGSRCGDIDPGVLLYMQRELGFDASEVEKVLNKESGLKGLCGSSDLREIESRSDDAARLALEVYVRRIVKYIGAYWMLLPHVDAVVFSGGVGENSVTVRKMVMQRIEKLGIVPDFEANEQKRVTISKKQSPTALYVIRTNEELEILRQAKEVLNG